MYLLSRGRLLLANDASAVRGGPSPSGLHSPSNVASAVEGAPAAKERILLENIIHCKSGVLIFGGFYEF